MAAIKLYFGLIFLGVTAFVSSFFCNQGQVDSASVMSESVYSVEQSREIAEAFVSESATFTFDNIDGTLELTDIDELGCLCCWKFVFEYQSNYAGYGDRTGMVVAQVVTPHKAEITVVEGKITRAVLDGWWDMIAQDKI